MLPDLSVTTWLLSAVIIFVAYLVRGIAGFGSALVAVPLLALILPLNQVVPMVIAVDFSASVQQAIRERGLVKWQDLLPIFPFSFMGLLVALFLYTNLDLQVLLRALGIFIVAFALYSLRPNNSPKPKGKIWAAPLGFLGGFIGSLFGTGGPFYVMYLRMRQLDKATFRGTTAMLFTVDGGIRLIGLSLIGIFNWQILILVLLAIPMKLAGFHTGHYLHHKLDERKFMLLVSVLLMLSGLSLIYKTI